MAFSKDSIPVYTSARELLYYAPLATVPHLIEEGRVHPFGTRKRVRSLVAISGAEDALRAERPPTGQKFSDQQEAIDNPRGVWRFRRSKLSYV